MSQILEDNFNSFIGATYGCEPNELPLEQLKTLRFAFFGGAMIVHAAIVEKQRDSDVELFNLQVNLDNEFSLFEKEIKKYTDEDIENIKNAWDKAGRNLKSESHIYEFPQQMFSPTNKKSESGKSLLTFEAYKTFPAGWKVTDFDKEQKLVEVEEDNGNRNWLSLPLLFKQIDFTNSVKIKMADDVIKNANFHSVGSTTKKDKERLFLIFEAE